MAIILPADVREHLAGDDVGLYLAKWGSRGEQDAKITTRIAAAVAHAKRRLQLQFDETVIKCLPDSTLELGTDYDVEEQPYDYHPAQWGFWGWMRLRRGPIVSVEQVRITFGPTWDVASLPEEWVRINDVGNSIAIVPTPGVGYTSILFATGGYIAPYLQMLAGGQPVPGTLSVDYTVGIVSASTAADWADLRRVLALKAAAMVFSDLSEARYGGRGGVSLSGDGLSESFQLTKFANTAQMKDQEAEVLLKAIIDTQTTMPLVSA